MFRPSIWLLLLLPACFFPDSLEHYVHGHWGGLGMPWNYRRNYFNPWLQHELVPDILFGPPPAVLQVVYNNSYPVNFGAVLTPTQVQSQPTFLRWPCRGDSLYTLVFLDPDAPSRENATLRSFQHWLVGNIPGCHVHRGTTLTQFIGSGPREGSGFHRYTYLIFLQPKQIEFDEPTISNTSATERPSFNLMDFAGKYWLTLLAGNFYRAQYDSYVPTLYAQLGFA
nr:protein D3-like [Penaeus vannamei]